MVLSLDADASREPSAVEATELTPRRRPSSVCTHVPVAASQIFSVSSQEPDACRVPSDAKATHVTLL
jgi:hypothetical protein